MKLTLVPFWTNPDPVMVSDVPPVTGPVVALRLVTDGTTGLHTQLSMAMLDPQ